jgi:hypothetical protein
MADTRTAIVRQSASGILILPGASLDDAGCQPAASVDGQLAFSSASFSEQAEASALSGEVVPIMVAQPASMTS